MIESSEVNPVAVSSQSDFVADVFISDLIALASGIWSSESVLFSFERLRYEYGEDSTELDESLLRVFIANGSGFSSLLLELVVFDLVLSDFSVIDTSDISSLDCSLLHVLVQDRERWYDSLASVLFKDLSCGLALMVGDDLGVWAGEFVLESMSWEGEETGWMSGWMERSLLVVGLALSLSLDVFLLLLALDAGFLRLLHE